MKRLVVSLFALALAGGCSSELPAPEPVAVREPVFDLRAARVLDLTYALPATDAGAGTRIVAPAKITVDAISPSRLVGPAFVIDARDACAKDPAHLVAMGDAHGEVPENAIVLVLTGWGRYWPERAYRESFPGIDPELARELVKRKTRAVGIDTAAVDPAKATKFLAQQALVDAGVPIIANVANLDAVPDSGAWVVAAPLKMEGAASGPLRLLAFGHRFRSSSESATFPRERAEELRALLPVEAEIVPAGKDVRARIAPSFEVDGRRAAELEAALSRACFAMSHPSHHHDHASKNRHLEPGTPDERMARYEEPGRDAWQRPDEVVKALALAPDAVAVDLGVGSGYFARRLAVACPKGKVIGLDVEPKFVEHVNAYAREKGLACLEARLVKEDDPGLAPASVDLVLIVDTYHHLGDRPSYLAKLKTALRPGGRIAIVDFRKGSKIGPPDEHKLEKEQVLEEARWAGLVLAREHDFLPEQWFIELTTR